VEGAADVLIVSKTSATKSSNGENPQEGGENLEDFLAEVLEMPTLASRSARFAPRQEAGKPKGGWENLEDMCPDILRPLVPAR